MIEFVSFSKDQDNSVRQQCDLVFNASSLPSPTRAMRQHTGINKDLQKEMFKDNRVQAFYAQCVDEVLQMVRTNQQVVVGVSCNAGKHRSVAIVERLVADEAFAGMTVVARHQSLFN